MFTDEQLEEGELIAEDLRQGSPIVFTSLAEQFQRMVDERDRDTVPRVMAVRRGHAFGLARIDCLAVIATVVACGG
jgi:hypothetical protein